MGYASDLNKLKNELAQGKTGITPYAEVKAKQDKEAERVNAINVKWAGQQLSDAKKKQDEKVAKELSGAKKTLEETEKMFAGYDSELQALKNQYIQAGYPENSTEVSKINSKINTFNEQKDIRMNTAQKTYDHAVSLQTDMQDWDDGRYLQEAGFKGDSLKRILGSVGHSEDEITKMVGTAGSNAQTEREQKLIDETNAAAGPAPTPTHLPSEQERGPTDYTQMPTREYGDSDITTNPKFAAIEGSPGQPEPPVTDVPTISDIDTPTGTQAPTGAQTGVDQSAAAKAASDARRAGEAPVGANTQAQMGVASGASGATGAQGSTPENIEAALSAIDGDARIPDDLKPLFKQVVQNWDVNQELNFENVLGTFNDIKSKTIDPYFAEQIQQFTNDAQKAKTYQKEGEQRELEQLGVKRRANIEGAQQSLEARGRTFTGEGIKELGAKGAYAEEGTAAATKSAIPTFAGGVEGKVNQANRLMTTAAATRQKKAAEDLARQAEKALGTTGAKQAGFQTVGDVTQGSFAQQKQKATAGTLTNLYNQQQDVNKMAEPVKIFN